MSLPNLIIDSGVHSYLHLNYHHQIVYAKFNLEITYPDPYLREVWHYKDVLILNLFEEQNWTRAFSNQRVTEKVNFFNNAIPNILSNFIPHQELTIQYKMIKIQCGVIKNKRKNSGKKNTHLKPIAITVTTSL